MVRRLNGITILSSMVLLAAIVVIVGCSGKTPLNPADNPNSLNRLATPTTLVATDLVEAEKLISADLDDSISIIKNYKVHKYVVPEGALDVSTVIDVKAFSDKVNDKKAIIFEFGPEGLIFNVATKLNIDISELDAGALTVNLYYFDPKANDWVFQGTVPVNNGRAEFNIYHFSKYAIN